MYKFKVSKFKNALPKVPKKEGWITDLSVGSPQSAGNHIKASSAFMAFNVESGGGGCLAVLPINTAERKDKSMALLYAHSEFVTDFDFSPFDDHLLVTGSQDSAIKIWCIPQGGLKENMSSPIASLPCQERRIENILFHPSAEQVLATSIYNVVKIWDIEQQEEKYVLQGHDDVVQNFAWKMDGSLLVTTCKDKKIRVFDPRSNIIIQEVPGHQNIKDSNIIWLGETDYFLSTGFDSLRQRQVCIRDLRNMNDVTQTISYDTSTGILIPLHDPDTNMLFIAGKADNSIAFFEFTTKDPYLTESSRHLSELQTKGIARVPKRALNIMQCEVNRLLQLTQYAVIPISYHVTRKTYRDFHADLFPETYASEPAMTAQEWFLGENQKLAKMSLDPLKPYISKSTNDQINTQGQKYSESPAIHIPSSKPAKIEQNLITKTPSPKFYENGNSNMFNGKPAINTKQTINNKSSETPGKIKDPSTWITETPPNTPPAVSSNRRSPSPERIQLRRRGSVKKLGERFMLQSQEINTPIRKTSDETPRSPKLGRSFGVRPSKFRHLKGTPLHKKTHIENIRNLGRSTPGECNGFYINTDRLAVPTVGPGGQIAVLEMSKTGKLPDGVLPVIQNGSPVMDFTWDPFNNSKLIVACDDAKIRIWEIPRGGLTKTLLEPQSYLVGHKEKIYFVKFHPLAQDVLASGSYDLTIKLWDLQTGNDVVTLEGHTDQIFNMAWSPDGKQLATVCKDNKIRIYDPRSSVLPIKEGQGPEGSRGARILWACNGKYLVVSGFDKVSERQITLHSVSDISSSLTRVGIDVCPAILIPHFDEDSSTLFLTGKGDSTIYCYEVAEESPHFFPLSHCRCASLHQALAFLPKNVCNIKDVEFARALRLTNSSIEPMSFTVPRVKMDLFQDDLFPDTIVTWEPTMTSLEWFSGANRPAKKITLQPENMPRLSDNIKTLTPTPKKYEQSYRELKSDNQKKQDLVSAVSDKLLLQDNKALPQDSYEGVDENEWDD